MFAHVGGMTTPHPHAAALDRLGKGRVIGHFNITDRSWRNWRLGGVPKYHHNSLRTLALLNGVTVKELDL